MARVLITATHYKSPQDLRFQLALTTCLAANKAGYSLIVVDGSTDPSIKKELRHAGATVYEQTEPGMGASRRQAIRVALDTFNAQELAWIEPEKYPLVPLLTPCFELVESGIYDVVLPTRESLESYPKYQELSELRANRAIGLMTGRPDLDFYFGVRVMNRHGAQLFLSYDGHAGDEWHLFFLPLVSAIAKKSHRIGQRRVAYIHPPEQTAAEEGDEMMDRKRDRQREVLVSALRDEAERQSLVGLL